MTDTNPPPSVPLPSLSVSELAQKLKRTLEQQFDYVRVRGELSRVTRHSSGHIYTDLKDADAVINSVCWRGVASKLSVQPTEGLEVICTGRISTYPQRSNYQLIIDSMEVAGQGAILKLLEERKKKLAAEGLFAPERKKPIPFLPQTIGVITSPTGAVIRDILHRIRDRFPSHVLVWPVTVQGENTARDVIAAIEGFNALPADGLVKRPDVLIVARGGGSVEDLMPFNDEALVRAVAASQIPIISAVGHETDTNLIDYAADLRAPTPTAAAEHAVPVRNDLFYTVQTHQQRITQIMLGMIRHDRANVKALEARLGPAGRMLDPIQQRLDWSGSHLQRALTTILHTHQQRVSRVNIYAYHPGNLLRQAVQTVTHHAQRLNRAVDLLIQQQHQHVRHHNALLESYSFKKTLDRGFALVRGADQHPVTNAVTARQQRVLSVQFADGVVKTNPEK
jgi:exodeoxyribonuclease VII large subunit